jgi:hypothetical protein
MSDWQILKKDLIPGANFFRRAESYKLLKAIRDAGPPLWSSGQEFLATDPEVRVRFQALLDFLRSIGSGTGSTQPREYN